MKEKEFKKRLSEARYQKSLIDTFPISELVILPIYYYIDDNGDIKIDAEEMKDEFETKLNKIIEILEAKK